MSDGALRRERCNVRHGRSVLAMLVRRWRSVPPSLLMLDQVDVALQLRQHSGTSYKGEAER